MKIQKKRLLSLALLMMLTVFTACGQPKTPQSVQSGSSAAESSAEHEAVKSEPESGEALLADTEGETGQEANQNENTAEALPDGSYVPTYFNAEGGTGKVTFTCPEVVIAEGRAVAQIELSSAHYEWLKVDGVEYGPDNAKEADRKNSVFKIPVVLDEEMVISGLTTAMSEPHEVEYTLFISLTQKVLSSEEERAARPEVASAGADSAAAGEEDKTVGAKEAFSSSEVASAGAASETGQAASQKTDALQTGQTSTPPVIEGLTFLSAMEKSYAETFDIFTYSLTDGSLKEPCYLIDVHGSARYLLLPESTTAESDNSLKALTRQLPDNITVLKGPLDNLYVAATSAMALFDAAGAIDQVTLTGTRADGWYIDAPKNALAEGRMVYAGKYSAPDYELLASSGCGLAVESTMILHAPEVKEKLEELGIPVFVDTSSNESHPLGRTEWVRLYGVLTGHTAKAEDFFNRQKAEFDQADNYLDTGLTVAFFSISSSGKVVVRAANDYVPRMIEMAGGEYIFKDLLSESGSTASVRISMEDFYHTARDADFLIYNATIESPVESVEELCERSALLCDFKAVQKGRVWQVERSLYQSPDIAARMITDIHGMLMGGDAADLTFLVHLSAQPDR